MTILQSDLRAVPLPLERFHCGLDGDAAGVGRFFFTAAASQGLGEPDSVLAIKFIPYINLVLHRGNNLQTIGFIEPIDRF